MSQAVIAAGVSVFVSAGALAQAPKPVSVKDVVDLQLLTHAEVNDRIHNEGKTSVLVGDFYNKTHGDIDMYFYEHKRPIGGHGAVMETSEMREQLRRRNPQGD